MSAAPKTRALRNQRAGTPQAALPLPTPPRLIVGIDPFFLANRPERARGACDGVHRQKGRELYGRTPGSQGRPWLPGDEFRAPRRPGGDVHPPEASMTRRIAVEAGNLLASTAVVKRKRPPSTAPAPASSARCTRSSRRRWVSTLVFPLPAPATINNARPRYSTASRCCGFRPSTSWFGSFSLNRSNCI